MKQLYYFEKNAIITLILIAFAVNNVFSQGNTLKITGNNNFDAASKVGPTNNADFKMISRDSTRMTVTKDGNVIIEKDLLVNGKIKSDSIHVNSVTCDSMKITQYITADSIHVRSLKIGDSSLWIGGAWSGSFGALQDVFQSSNLSINFLRRQVGLPFHDPSEIRVGIGTISPNYKLHLHDQPSGPSIPPLASPVYMQYTNAAFGGYGGTGKLFSDGFLIGIDKDGNAQLNQQENKDMLFYTGSVANSLNAERMRIDNTGRVGINNLTVPSNRLTISTNDDINCGYFSSTSSAVVAGTHPATSVIESYYTRNGGFQGPAHGICSIMQVANCTTEVIGLHAKLWDCNDAVNTNYGLYSDVEPKTLGTNYGIYSLAQNAKKMNIAGYFTAPYDSNYPNSERHAIVTEKDGSNVCISCDATALTTSSSLSYALYLNGEAYKTMGSGIWIGSDSIIKTNISSYYDGLNVIKNIKPVYYNYNGLAGTNTDRQYIGVIGEQIASIAPYMVDTVNMILHPLDTFKTPVLTFNPDAFYYMSINAIKQLDSSVTNMSSAAENGLHIDTAAAGNPVKMGGTINETTTIGLKRNLIFTSDNTNTGQVCIGSPTTATSEALMVNNKTWMTSAKFINSKTTASDNIAGGFLAYGSFNNNYGAQFIGKGDGNLSNYGATFEASGHSKTNYAVYATASGGSMADYAGYFNGNLYASSYLNLPSDSKLKENVQPITDAMSIINQLQPKTFTFKASSFPSINLPAGMQYGLIAQEVSPILPTLVSTTIHPAVYDSVGNMVYDTVQSKSLNYEAFIPILIQGAKEQQSKMDSMALLIQNLQDQMAQVLGGNNGGAKLVNTINVELVNGAVLYQNIPNPFAEETTINYYIPDNTSNAKIIFFDMYGQSLKDVPLTEKGSGNIHVDSKNLSSGIYTYSLVIDGKVIDTKKMVKNK